MSVSSCDSSTNSDVRSLLMWFHWNLIKNRARTSSAKRQSCLQSIFNSISRPIKSLFRFPFFSHHHYFLSHFFRIILRFLHRLFVCSCRLAKFSFDFSSISLRFILDFTSVSIVLRFSHQVIQEKNKNEWLNGFNFILNCCFINSIDRSSARI